MHRAGMRSQSPGGMGQSPGGPRCLPGGRLSSPGWGFGASPSMGPRFGYCGSPSSPGGFRHGSRNSGPNDERYSLHQHHDSPVHRHSGGGRGSPGSRRPAPYQHGFQGSGQRSTDAGVEKYFSPSMLQDPWARMVPVTVPEGPRGAGHSASQRRYF